MARAHDSDWLTRRALTAMMFLCAGNRLPAAVGYGKGVPMGGELQAAPAGRSPTFLVAAMKGPDFDPQQRAFFYARVLKIPTPRWTAYDANRYGTQPLPGTAMTLQERACTSPLWYTPGG